ncbi:MAG TPA: hypothetical protein VMV57_04280, partial [Terracidiphilus sp.]|nr:hypothetical protein [Terracidiphilus sp.]
MRKFVFALALTAFAATAFAAAQASQPKRPITFKDMMAMKRLGSTAVSPDGKWLAYSVTTVNLEKNSKTTELFLQPIAGGEPQKVAVAQPGDSGLQFAPDGHQILFLSARSGSQQIWLAAFDPATGAATDPTQLTHLSIAPDNALWAPDGKSIAFTAFVYPDCPAFTQADASEGSAPDKCNAEKDAATAASPVKAQIFTHLLFRHWDHWTGPKRSHLFLVAVQNPSPQTLPVRDLTPHQANDVPPFSLEGGGCGCAFSPDSKQIAYTLKDVPVPAISTNADIFTLDLDNPTAKAVKVSTSPGGDFSPAYSPDGKYLAWRSQARAGYESDKFRLVLYNREEKTIRDLLPNFDNWVDEFAWSPDSKQVYFVSGVKGGEPLFATSLEGKMTLKNNDGEFSGLHPLPDGRSIVASRMTVASPSEVVAVSDPVSGPAPKNQFPIPGIQGTAQFGSMSVREIRQITSLNTALLYLQLDMPKMQPFWFTAKDGTKLQGFIVKPPNFNPAKKYPVKFLIHG